MNGSIATVERTQTTVSVGKDALESVDELARMSGVSRSRLFDMAVRRFARWAQDVHPDALRQIAEYETEGRTSPYVRKTSSSGLAALSSREGSEGAGQTKRLTKPGLASVRPSEAPSEKLVRRDR